MGISNMSKQNKQGAEHVITICEQYENNISKQETVGEVGDRLVVHAYPVGARIQSRDKALKPVDKMLTNRGTMMYVFKVVKPLTDKAALVFAWGPEPHQRAAVATQFAG